MRANATELGDVGEEPWEEFSFLFNGLTPWNQICLEIGFNAR